MTASLPSHLSPKIETGPGVVRHEASWGRSESSKAWLEERYPLLEDASLGSPLFRYMKDHATDPTYVLARKAIFVASMLSFHEAVRYSEETGLLVGFDTFQEKLYPDYGIPNPHPVSEPNWSDRDASRTWLEQYYPLGPISLGSPLFRYMQGCHESRHLLSSPTTHLGSMLTNVEWNRFLTAYPNTGRRRNLNRPDPILLYPEYDFQIWPGQGPGKFKPPRDAGLSTPGSSHIGSLPSPAAEPARFSESYPPHLRRQSLSSSPFNKSMPPPPRARQKAADTRLHPGTMSPSQQRNNEEESSSSRRKVIDVTRTQSRPTHGLVEARKDPETLKPSTESAEMQIAGLVKQYYRSMEKLKMGGPVQTSAIATKAPAYARKRPMSTEINTQLDQQGYLEDKSESSILGYQPRGQHTKARSIWKDSNAADKAVDKESSPLLPDPQHQNRADTEVVPDAEESPDDTEIDSDSFGHRPNSSLLNTSQADPSRKRSIGDVEDKQSTSSPYKKRRAAPSTGDDGSLVYNRLMETPLVGPSRKRSIGDVEDEQSTSSPYKKRRVVPSTGDDGSLVYKPLIETSLSEFSMQSSVEELEDASPMSSPSENRHTPSNTGDDGPSSTSTETPLADLCRKRSIEDVEDAPPTTSSPKRKRKSPKYGENKSPPSSPFDPPERSTPTPSPSLDQIPTDNARRGFTPCPQPLRPESPSYEDAMTVIFRPEDIDGTALQSASQSEAIKVRNNPEATDTDNRRTAHLRDHNTTLNSVTETQDHSNDGPASPGPESQGEHLIKLEEDPEDMVMDSEHLRNQTNTHVVQDSGDRMVQKAISVVIPLQIPQRQPAANQELSPDGNAVNVPKNYRGGRKPGAEGGKAGNLESQRKQPKRKPPTKGTKDRQSPRNSEQQDYVGRLRSGVGERKHKKPRLVILEFKGRKAVQVKAN